MDNSALAGTLTALVTPLNHDGSLDLGALDALVDVQLAAGVGGLVPCGTTGESVTLSVAERAQVIGRVALRAAGRVPVVAGTGSSCTASTVIAQQQAHAAGATHGLVVTPYYNKPSRAGLRRHYAAVAAAVDLPVIAYNVPGRTGCDLGPEGLCDLVADGSIVAVKEATGDLGRLTALRRAAPELRLLSGDDATACPFVLLGGHGVISVVSNVAPAAAEMVTAALHGKVALARALHDRLMPLVAALFVEANPVPVKAALAWQGIGQEVYRPPLAPLAAASRAQLRAALHAALPPAA